MRRTLSLFVSGALILFPARGQTGDIGDKAEDRASTRWSRRPKGIRANRWRFKSRRFRRNSESGRYPIPIARLDFSSQAEN